MIEPTNDDWKAIQAMVDDDCPLSIVAQLGQKEIPWEEASDRIEAYARAAFTQGRFTWIKVSERKPEATVGMGAGHPPILSGDVLCYFPGAECEFKVCNYDHEEDFWTIAETLASADCEPSHWTTLQAPSVPL